MLQVPPETIRVLLQLPNIRVPHYVHPTLWLPSAMKLEFSQWAQLYSEEDPSDVDNLIEGSFGYRAAQYGQLRSQWIAEDCGACEQFGLIERTDPTTTLGGFRRINRGQVPLFTPSRDGSVGFLQLQQLPDRPGTTLDGDKLAGSGNFVLPLRNRVQLVGDPPPIPQDQEQCDPIQNGESKAALCLSVQAYRRDTSETTEVQVKQLTDSTAYVETLSGPSEGFDSPRAKLWKVEHINSLPSTRLMQVLEPRANDADLARSTDAWNRTDCLSGVRRHFAKQDIWIGGLFETVSGAMSVIRNEDGRWILWDCSQQQISKTLGQSPQTAAQEPDDDSETLLAAHQDRAVALSHDGTRLALYPVDEDFAVGIFDVGTGKVLAKMLGADGRPRRFEAAMRSATPVISRSELMFSPTDRRLVFYGTGSTGSEQAGVWELFVWNASTGELLFQRPQWRIEDFDGKIHQLPGPPERCHYTDTCGGEIPHWYDEMATLDKPVPAGLAWAPDESFVVVIEQDGPTQILEDLGGKPLAEFLKLYTDHPDLLHPLMVSISPDGSRVQIGSYFIDRTRWELLLNLHRPGKALWLNSDWTTAAVSDTAGFIEFFSLAFADKTISGDNLKWRDLLLRREFLND